MASNAAAVAAPQTLGRRPPAAQGLATLYLSLIVLLPLAALLWRSADGGRHAFWSAVSGGEAVAALELTLVAAFAVAAVNAVAGTLLAWVLVRDRFRGQGIVNALIDLPFALPTIVAGLTLVALYGPRSPIGVNVAYTRSAVVLALLFVTLPFVAPVYIYGQIQSGNQSGAAALSVVLLVISLAVLLAIGALRRYAWRHSE